MNKGVKQAIKKAGSRRKLAKMLRIAHPQITYYLLVSLPPNRAMQIKGIYNDIPLSDLRPDLWQ